MKVSKQSRQVHLKASGKEGSFGAGLVEINMSW